METMKWAFALGMVVGMMAGCGGKGSGGSDAGLRPCESELDCPAGYDCLPLDGGLFCVAQPDAGPGSDAASGTPLMVLDATGLDFGNPLLGVAVEVDLTISNEGDGDLLLYDLQLVEGDDVVEFFLGAPSERPIVVVPGASVVVTVTLIAEDAELDTGYLLLASNDPLNAAVLVPLVSAFKGTPELGACVHPPPSPPTDCAEPPIFDFGLVNYAAASELVARLRNENLGNAILTVEEVTIPEPPVVPADLFDYELFTLEEDPGNPGTYSEVPASLPYLLGPQQSTPDLYLRLIFVADVDRLLPDMYVVVDTDAPDNASVDLPISWSVNGCPPGTLDLDPVAPGCEYDCPVWPGVSEACNNVDDDCDGDVDEDFDLTTDPSNCGFCGHLCDLPNAQSDCSNSLCVITACVTSGASGFANVNGDPADGCEYACPVWPTVAEVCDEVDNDCDGDVDEDFNLQSDPFNCGTCGNDCSVLGQVCAAGQCVLTCPPGTTNCDGACVDTDTDPDYCGDCTTSCAFDHAQATCLAATCVMGPCDAGFQNLDGQDANGCEYTCPVWPTSPELCDTVDNDCDGDVDETFDLQNDPVNCGTCGTVCGYPNAQSLCVTGGCQMGPCLAGYRDLDGQDGNGCEYTCPVSPPVAEVCNGVDDNCDGNVDEIFDLQNDPTHCGDCTTVCSYANAMALCVSGACNLGPCNAGFMDLNGSPSDGCEYTCPVWPPVSEVCDGVDNNCNGTADEGYDTQNDPVNCGTCGTVCSYPNATALCISGSCQLGACDAGFGNADGIPANGCECTKTNGGVEACDGLDNNCNGVADETFDFNNDPTHCGDCTTVCAYANATPLCTNGTCQMGPCDVGFSNVDGGAANGCEYPCPVNPPVPEVCNGVDDNCDGTADETFNLLTDPTHCGDCTTVCSYTNATPLCIAGGCQMGACDAGFGDADGSPANGCECSVTNGGVEACDGQDNNCNGVADETFDFNNDPTHCGDCTTVCAYANATPLCTNGTCQMGPCDVGFSNVDGGAANGCEYPCPVNPPVAEVCNGVDDNCDGNADETFDFLTDPSHCGDCTTVCSFANATPLCINGTCQMGACNAGFGDADGSPANGCECTITNGGVEACDGADNNCNGAVDETFDFNNDPTHCGDCTTVCAYAHAQALCMAGSCQMGACDADYRDNNSDPSDGCEYGCPVTPPEAEVCDGLDNDCDGDIDESFDFENDPLNCGSCGMDCSKPNALVECVATVCNEVACLPSYYDLNGDLHDATSDGCEYQCPTHPPEVEVCDYQDNNCDGNIDEGYDTDNDPLNCGVCGNDCGAGALCCGGFCVPDDETNCGYCGRSCGGGVSCFNGSCIEPGIILITEMFLDPAAVTPDALGEFIEVYNTTTYSINLKDWLIYDDDFDSHTIAEDVWVPAGGYAVLAQNATYATNGGVIVDYQYSGIALGNSGDELIFEADLVEVDRVNWNDGFETPARSQQLDPDFYDDVDNNNLANWCDTDNGGSYQLPGGDHGTPGAPNHQCP